MSAPPPPEPQGFDALYGLELIECSQERASARVRVRDQLMQPAGLVHGGVYGAIAEALSSLGTSLAIDPEHQLALGLTTHTTVLRPIAEGTIHASAVRRHRGRTTWVWEVEISDDRDGICAHSRVTVAIREA
jgi:1,4-dihydroxy-2-naphthoyl-CoA hydrolase